MIGVGDACCGVFRACRVAGLNVAETPISTQKRRDRGDRGASVA